MVIKLKSLDSRFSLAESKGIHSISVYVDNGSLIEHVEIEEK